MEEKEIVTHIASGFDIKTVSLTFRPLLRSFSAEFEMLEGRFRIRK